MSGDRVERLARPRPHASHHHPLLPLADAAWPHRLPSSAPSVGLAVPCGGVRSGPRQTPVAPLRAPPRAFQQRGAAVRLGRRAMAWPSHVSRRWLGRLHARYACLTNGVRPADGATAGVRRSRGPALGAVPCGDRCAPEARGRASPHPRSGPGAGGPSACAGRGCTGGGSGPVFLCASRPPRPRRRAGGAARRRAPDGRLHARSAVGQAECAADICRHRRAPSRWRTARGVHDHLVAWLKPKPCPSWLTRET